MTHDYKKALVWLKQKYDESFASDELLAGFSFNAQKWKPPQEIETIRHALTLASEYERVKKENDKLIIENCIYSARHKAWEECVYAVGLPMMKAVRDTEYGDAVPPIPVVNKITDLLDECFKLRKERDELAEYILEVDDSCRTLFGDDAHELAKKVRNENGNARCDLFVEEL